MVEWLDARIQDPPFADDESVRWAERALRIRLPEDFLAVARTHQGARPVPSGIALHDGFVTAVGHLLHFEQEPFMSNIVHRMFPLDGVLKKGIIPFAEDIGGDLFCFNYRKDSSHPTVVFWSVDTADVLLAPDFTTFLTLLFD